MFEKKSLIVPYISLFLGAILWASSFAALKIAFLAYHPMVVIFGRMVVGSLCFLLITVTFKKLSLKHIPWKDCRKDLRLIAVMVICEPCLYFVFEAKAVELTTTSQAGFITSMMPLMVSLVAFFVLKESLSQKTLAGLIISVSGACWLSFSGNALMNAPNPPLGNMLEFIAMCFAAGYTICLKKLTEKGYSPFLLTGLQAIAGSFFYFFILLLPSTTLPEQIAPLSMWAVIYLGAAVTLGAYGFFNFGVSRIPAGQASSFINLIPIFALIFGMVILNEKLSTQQYMACLIIMAGILLSQQKAIQPVAVNIVK